MPEVYEKVLQIGVGVAAVALGNTTSLKDVVLGTGGLAIIGHKRLKSCAGAEANLSSWCLQLKNNLALTADQESQIDALLDDASLELRPNDLLDAVRHGGTVEEFERRLFVLAEKQIPFDGHSDDIRSKTARLLQSAISLLRQQGGFDRDFTATALLEILRSIRRSEHQDEEVAIAVMELRMLTTRLANQRDDTLPLIAETFEAAKGSNSALEMAYNKRRTRFVGRSDEKANLAAFLADPRRLLWWQLSGDGGQGKSRLALETVLGLDGAWHAGFLTKDALLKTDWQNVAFPEPTLIVIDYLTDSDKAAAFANAIRLLRARSSENTGRQLDHKLRLLVIERSPYDFDADGGFSQKKSWLSTVPDLGDPHQMALEELAFERQSGHLGAPSDAELIGIAASWRRERSLEPLGNAGEDALWNFLSGHQPVKINSRAKGARPLFAIIFAETYQSGEDSFTLDTGLRRILEIERLQLFGQREAATPNLALLANMIEQIAISDLDEMATVLSENHGDRYRAARFYTLSEPDEITNQIQRAARANGYSGGAVDTIEARAPDIIAEFHVIETLGKPGQVDRLNQLAADAWKMSPYAFMSFLNRLRQDFGSTNPARKLLKTFPSYSVVSVLERGTLLLAATFGLPGLVRALLENGATPSVSLGGNGAFPLLMAAHNGHTDCVQALINAGADVNQCHEQIGGVPLLMAAQEGYTKSVQALINAGADGNQRHEQTGVFPLLMAAQEGHTDCVQALINAGADVNQRHEQIGTFPLLMAAQNGHTDCVQALLNAGADGNQRHEQNIGK